MPIERKKYYYATLDGEVMLTTRQLSEMMGLQPQLKVSVLTDLGFESVRHSSGHYWHISDLTAITKALTDQMLHNVQTHLSMPF